jgi:hypothetical protein
MADKKKSSKSQPKTKGGVGAARKRVSSRAPASAEKSGTKGKNAPSGQAQGKVKDAKKAAPMNGKQPNKQPLALNNQKRKPPSITITRPEVTRPPAVQMPVPKAEAPAGAPSLLLPRGGEAIRTVTPIFRWMYVGGATRYEVEWSRDQHFGRGHSVSTVSLQTAVTLDPSQALQTGANYQWRVRGGNDSGWGPWSAPESFRVPEKI